MPNDDPALDVTLRSGHATRYWLITRSWNGLNWRYEQRGGPVTSSGEALTLREALAKRDEFEAEIRAARADGWK